DLPVTKGQMVVFHGYPSGNLMSMPRSSVKTVVQIQPEQAKYTNLAESVVPIGNLAMQGGSSQAGPQNLRTVGQPRAARENQRGGPAFTTTVTPGQPGAMPTSPND